jgi:peptidoglycan/LPS O-acetylase OafA/YrhL
MLNFSRDTGTELATKGPRMTAARAVPAAPLIFPAIDLLRGFAALSVVVYHVIEHMGWSTFPGTGALLWFRIGWMGVDLFFVISGFVIALSAFSLIDKLGDKEFRMPFVRRRVSRILPLHYLTCLVFIVAIGIGTSGLFMNLVSHLGFFHNMDWRWHGAINGVNWSIGVEMQFYLLIFFLAPILRKCTWWLIPLVAVSIAWAWRYGVFLQVPIDGDLGPFMRFLVSTQLPGTLDQFAVGILLARFVRAPQCATFFAFLRSQPWTITLVATGLVWLSLSLFWSLGPFWETVSLMVFWRSLISLAFGAVVLAACCYANPVLMRATAPLRYLGTISYGIYLWHLIVILLVKKIEGITPGLALAVVLGITLILASASWHFFEQRLLRR